VSELEGAAPYRDSWQPSATCLFLAMHRFNIQALIIQALIAAVTNFLLAAGPETGVPAEN
jgi:hypothetical protein